MTIDCSESIWGVLSTVFQLMIAVLELACMYKASNQVLRYLASSLLFSSSLYFSL